MFRLVVFMARARTILALLVAAPLGLGSAFVFAQVAAQAPAAAESEIDEDIRMVPPAKFSAVAKDAITSMRGSMQRGLDELRSARDKKDAVQLTCVNEHVTSMKGVLRVAENASVDLEEAQATNQTARTRYEFRKVATSKKRMDNLLGQALNCAGADSSFSTTAVVVEIDDAVLQFDPYYGDPDFFADPQHELADLRTGRLGEPDPPSIRPPPASGVL
jgi:hypothetical protein